MGELIQKLRRVRVELKEFLRDCVFLKDHQRPGSDLSTPMISIFWNFLPIRKKC